MLDAQARAEDYSETLAFIRLLNALLAAAPGGPPGGGRQYAHLTEFVRVDVLGQLSQRGYRQASSSMANSQQNISSARTVLTVTCMQG